MPTYIKSLYQTFTDKHCYREFKHFLVTEKAYKHFIQNVRLLNHDSTTKHFYIYDWIDRAFCWANTPQQHTFWSKIDGRWRMKVNKIKYT